MKIPLDIQTYCLGQLQTNCYLIADSKTHDAIIIDPADEGSFIAEQLERKKLTLKAIFLTHGHFDHLLGAFELQQIYHIPVFMSTKDQFLVDRMRETAKHFLESEIVEQKPTITDCKNTMTGIGSISIQIISVPGHTPGGIAIYMKEGACVFTGDTIFSDGAIGRYDHSYSNKEDLMKSVKTILELPLDTSIYPGHGTSTTVGVEKHFLKLAPQHI